MKVKEWMEKLKELDQEKEVEYHGDGTCMEIKHIEYDEHDDNICIW